MLDLVGADLKDYGVGCVGLVGRDVDGLGQHFAGLALHGGFHCAGVLGDVQFVFVGHHVEVAVGFDCVDFEADLILLPRILNMVVIRPQRTIGIPLGIKHPIPKQERRIGHIPNILNLHPGKIHRAIGLTGIQPHHIMPGRLRMLRYIRLIINELPIVARRLKTHLTNTLKHLNQHRLVLGIVHFDGDGLLVVGACHEVVGGGWDEPEVYVLGV